MCQASRPGRAAIAASTSMRGRSSGSQRVSTRPLRAPGEAVAKPAGGGARPGCAGVAAASVARAWQNTGRGAAQCCWSWRARETSSPRRKGLSLGAGPGRAGRSEPGRCFPGGGPVPNRLRRTPRGPCRPRARPAAKPGRGVPACEEVEATAATLVVAGAFEHPHERSAAVTLQQFQQWLGGSRIGLPGVSATASRQLRGSPPMKALAGIS